MRGVWMMDPLSAHQYYPIIHKLLAGNISFDPQLDSRENNNMPKGQGRISQGPNMGLRVVDAAELYYSPESIKEPSIFVLDIIGPITKYNQFCGPAGMKAKGEWLRLADAHPNIFAHVLNIDSPGGEGYACRHFSSVISAMKKPVFSFVDGMAASAAYWIASSTSFIACASNMDRVGSIGTYITIADYSAWYINEGVRLVDVYATKSVDKNRDYIKAIEGDTSEIKNLADKFNAFFLDAVKSNRSNRGLNEENVWGTGKMFFASEAQSIGMIDETISLEDYLSEIHKEYSPK